MSLRVRLGLVAAAAVAAAVALASVVLYFIVENELRGQVNRKLQEQVVEVSRLGPSFDLSTSIGDGQFGFHVPSIQFGLPYQLVDSENRVLRPIDTLGRPFPLLPMRDETRFVAARAMPAFYFDSHIN